MYLVKAISKNDKTATTRKFETLEECETFLLDFPEVDFETSIEDEVLLIKKNELLDKSKLFMNSINEKVFEYEDDREINNNASNNAYLMKLRRYRSYLRGVHNEQPLPDNVMTFEQWDN